MLGQKPSFHTSERNNGKDVDFWIHCPFTSALEDKKE